jgi:Zn-dependent protease
MPMCYHCGTEVSESFNCIKCGQSYCSFHKDPIDHECNIVIESLNFTPQQAPQITPPYTVPTQATPHSVAQNSMTDGVIRGTSDGTYTWYRQEQAVPENAFDPDSGINFKGILLAHKSEFLHFLIGCTLIFLIGIISFYNQIINSGYIWALFMLAGFYMTAFLFHEFGHRQVALHFGLQTKFRLLTFGMLLTVLSLIMGFISLVSSSPTFPMLALPGAVVVLGLEKINRKTGLCKTAGPLVNLVYGSILLIISLIIPNALYPLNFFVGYASYFNFMLGAFNMIPIGILDGQNIWKWNKKIYLGLIASLGILLILTLIFINSPVGIYF